MATGKCCTIWRGEDSALRVSAQAQSCTRVGSLSRVMHLHRHLPRHRCTARRGAAAFLARTRAPRHLPPASTQTHTLHAPKLIQSLLNRSNVAKLVAIELNNNFLVISYKHFTFAFCKH